jgi:prepilin-type N-terminal cleavage/methylation domain-containing protein
MRLNVKFKSGGNVRRVVVAWLDCVWHPSIAVRFGGAKFLTNRRARMFVPPKFENFITARSAKSLPQAVPLCHSRRHFNFKNMKNTLPPSRRHRAGFTLVELLTVIAIIAILAAMLLPVLSRARVSAQKTKAKTEIQGLATAILKYDSDYGRFPISTNAQNQASQNAQANLDPDFTYGGTFQNSSGTTFPIQSPGLFLTNAEVIAILMDITNTSVTSVNMNHQKNPQQTIFLDAHMSGDTTSPGVGTDLVYRDPWGNPYVISMDLNYDEQCADAFYSSQIVSQTSPGSQNGYNGLFNLTAGGASDNFQYHGKVMVWSAGPPTLNGKPVVDNGSAANSSFNKGHILSWQ